MSGQRALSSILRFLFGFFGAMMATAALGFAVITALTTAVPQWKTTWAMAGATEKILWIALPTVILLGAAVLMLWRRHRPIALGVLVYAVADAAIAVFGR
jgi:hypothetical protein